MELRDHMVIYDLTEELPNLSKPAVNYFITPSTKYGSSDSSTFSATLVIVPQLDHSLPRKCEAVSHCDFFSCAFPQ